MKKLVVLLLLAAPVLVGCRTTQVETPAVAVGGATSSRAAVESFLAAARAQDVQAMSLIWGSVDGPARATMKWEELEKRELVMLCYLRHDSFRVVEEAASLNNQRRATVDLTLGAQTRRTTLTTVMARDGHWYVLSVDLEPLSELCAARR